MELELLFVSPDEDLNAIKEPKVLPTGGVATSGTTVECQTENAKAEKHVTFEDSISLTDSNLDPPLDDPSDHLDPVSNHDTPLNGFDDVTPNDHKDSDNDNRSNEGSTGET